MLPRALGGREAAREELATMPIDTDIDFPSGACSALLTREDGGPERGNRAVWEGLHRRARTRSGWINGWKWMFYWDTFLSYEPKAGVKALG